jgi:Spy/CpxP family protein refolding chaperone
MHMKRTLWSTAAALAIAAGVALPVVAQPPDGRGGPLRGPGGFGGRGGPSPILRGLDLTDAQREQVRSITQAQRGDANSPQRRLADFNRQLQLAILAETPDIQKIEELKTSIAAAAAEELTSRIDVQTRIAQVLTPEQRTRAREALSKAVPAQGGRRGARPRGV